MVIYGLRAAFDGQQFIWYTPVTIVRPFISHRFCIVSKNAGLIRNGWLQVAVGLHVYVLVFMLTRNETVQKTATNRRRTDQQHKMLL